MDKYNAAVRTKKAIDIILGLLFIALLGYSFTGAPFHEVAGIVFIVMTIVLALVGFVFIAFHVLAHAFGRVRKKYRALPVILAVLISLLAVLMDAWLLPYVKRHFLTVEIDQEMVIPGERVDIGGRKILTVYFTRVGNTNFDDDVDAVSGASLLLNEKEDFMGNS